MHLARHHHADAAHRRRRCAQCLRHRHEPEAIFDHGHARADRRLDDRELEAVLGHELTHIRNGDVRMMVIAVVIAGVISFFGEMVFRIFFQSALYGGFGGRRRGGDSEGNGGAGIAIVIAIALIALAWILSVVIRFALSRQREYLADAGSVELTKDPDAMIMALRKIEGRGELSHANSAVMEMCIDNPRLGFSDIFDTHPPIEARVEALVKFAGGHDPGPLALEPSEQRRQSAGREPRRGSLGRHAAATGPAGKALGDRAKTGSRSARPLVRLSTPKPKNSLERDPFRIKSLCSPNILLVHDLFRKPVPVRDHALDPRQRQRSFWTVAKRRHRASRSSAPQFRPERRCRTL